MGDIKVVYNEDGDVMSYLKPGEAAAQIARTYDVNLG